MKIKVIFKIVILSVVMFLSVKTNAQNCSVNSGTAFSTCIGQDTFQLAGGAGGLFATAATWSQISGPNTSTIVAPTTLTTQVADFVPGVYTYRVSAQCQDGSNVGQNVSITVDSFPIPKVNDTSFCNGGTIIPTSPSPSLPAGQTVTWNIFNRIGITTAATIGTGINPLFSAGGFLKSCPQSAQIEMRMTNGSCEARDTLTVNNEDRNTTTFQPHPDMTICGTSTNSSFSSNYGCNAVSTMIQISGPAAATINRSNAASEKHMYLLSSLIVGTYTFAYDVTLAPICGSANWKDTFTVTVVSTIALTSSSQNYYTTCSNTEDTIYYFSNANPLPPGQTAYWDLTTDNSYNLKLDTLNGVLSARTQNPGVIKFADLFSSTSPRYIYMQYVITNGVCSQRYDFSHGILPSRSPVPVNYRSTITLPCGTTSTNVAQVISGTTHSQSTRFPITLSKPSTAPNPTVQSNGSVSGLQAGVYVFSFQYGYLDNSTFPCGGLTQIVQVIVTSTPALTNAGTNQILPCGVDSTVLSGNIPPAGNIGAWEQVSGPSPLTLVNPNSPNIVIKNLLPGAYTLRWSLRTGPGCSNFDETTIFVTRREGSLQVDTLTKCFGMPVQITGTRLTNPTSAGTWIQFLGPAATISNSSIYNPIITGTAASTLYGFEWVVNGSCDSFIDTVFIQTTASQGPSNASISTADVCLSTTTSTTISALAPSVGSGRWRLVSGPNTPIFSAPTSTTTSVSSLTNGLYTIVWEVSNGSGCDTLRDTITIARRGTLSNFSASSPAFLIFCESDTIQFNASAFSINSNTSWGGNWSQTQGQLTTIEKVGTTGAKVYTMQPGVYQYRWTVGLGACPTASSLTTVTIYEDPGSATILTNDTLVCRYINMTNFTKSFSAIVPSAGTLVWATSSSSDGFSPTITSPTLPNTNITFRTGLYTVYANVINGPCISRDSAIVEIVPRAEAGPNISPCSASSVLLGSTSLSSSQNNYNGSATPLWTQRSGPNTATFTNANSRQTNAIGLILGRYVFDYQISHPSCTTTSDSVVVNILSPPTNVFAGNDTLICFSTPTIIPLRADTPSVYTLVRWERTQFPQNNITNFSNAFTLSTDATVNLPGLHQFRLTVNNGNCSVLDFIDVVVEQVPLPSINVTSFNACNDTVSLQTAVNIPNYNYAWSLQDGFRFTDSTGVGLRGPIVNHWEPPTNLGNKKVKLTLTNPASGCFSSDSFNNNISCFLLPVTFMGFEANCHSNSISIDWYTVMENNSSHFEIERSINGKNWTKIGQKSAQGTSFSTVYYTYTENTILSESPIHYYRLKIIDKNGSYTYSEITQVQCSENGVEYIKVYPNPIENELFVSAGGVFIGSLDVFDAAGKRVFSEKINNFKAVINTGKWSPGVYFVKIDGKIFKVVK